MEESHVNRQGELLFALLLLVFSITAFWQSYAISGFTGLTTAGVFPMLASVTMSVAAAVNLIDCARKANNNDLKNDQGFFTSILPLRIIVVIALISAYVILMPWLGFIISSALFLFASFSYLWRKSLLVSLAITVVALTTVYLIFRKLFQVVLPQGSLLQSLL